LLTSEFRSSRVLHAARTLLHLRFAEAESAAPEHLAHRITTFAWEAQSGGLALRCDVLRAEVAPGGRCMEQPLLQCFAFRDGPSGGELAAVESAPQGPPHEAVFAPTRAEHRARAFAHRWLWIWENLGDATAFDELLDTGTLDVHFHGGHAIATADEFRSEARRLGEGVAATHHVLDSLALDVSGRRYAVTAEVSWRGESAGGTPLRAHSRHAWELIDAGGRYPRLQRLRIELTEPLRAAVPEEARGPSVPNAPSDDAESGGP
jgi:hypothetical protein